MSALATTVLLMLISILSYLGLRRYLVYAIQAQILDVPNHRSSHVAPTPRGGGIAFAAAFLVGILTLGAARILAWPETLAAMAGLLIAAIGYLDDRAGVSIRLRLAVQVLAAVMAVMAVSVAGYLEMGSLLHGFSLQGRLVSPLTMPWLMVEVLGLTWLLNLTNFMDGIDGIVSVEILTVAAICGGLILVRHGFTPSALLFLMLSFAVAPFLLFNWSPARLFMGDAGSCFLGFTVGVVALIAASHHELSLAAPVILMAVFISDATTTLLTRMIRRERWYEAHRTHAFQILAARYGHRSVAGAAGMVNLLWLAPVAILAEHDPRHAVFYVVAAILPLVTLARLLGAGGTVPRLLLRQAAPPGVAVRMNQTAPSSPAALRASEPSTAGDIDAARLAMSEEVMQ